MLRFLNPGEPAGRLEFFVINLLLGALSVLFNVLFFGFAVVFETAAIEYESSMVTAFFFVFAFVTAISWISVLRRLKDLHLSGVWSLMLIAPLISLPFLPVLIVALPLSLVEAVVIGIPTAQILFILFLTFTRGMSRQTYAPYGSDPYDPDSWVPKSVALQGGGVPARGVTFNGQELHLPGDQEAA